MGILSSSQALCFLSSLDLNTIHIDGLHIIWQHTIGRLRTDILDVSYTVGTTCQSCHPLQPVTQCMVHGWFIDCNGNERDLKTFGEPWKIPNWVHAGLHGDLPSKRPSETFCMSVCILTFVLCAFTALQNHQVSMLLCLTSLSLPTDGAWKYPDRIYSTACRPSQRPS